MSKFEITDVSNYGIKLYFENKEYFMPYDEFPWFKEKTLKDVMNVELLSETHLYWPDLDVDLSLEMIEHPDRFPLLAK